MLSTPLRTASSSLRLKVGGGRAREEYFHCRYLTNCYSIFISGSLGNSESGCPGWELERLLLNAMGASEGEGSSLLSSICGGTMDL